MRYVSRCGFYSLLTFLGYGLFFAIEPFSSRPPVLLHTSPVMRTFLSAPIKANANPIFTSSALPVKQQSGLFCSDKKLLPIWRELQKDTDFREREPTGDCKDLLETKPSDLNADGTPEILVLGRYDLCGATGNCAFWIFSHKKGRYYKILASSDDVDRHELGDQVRGAKTNGYRNISLIGHITASDTSYQDYRFNGTRYVESRCLVESYPMSEDLPKQIVTCREFDKNWH